MINSKIEYTEDGSPRFIEASDAPHYTRLFHNLVKHIDHKPTAGYDIKTNIWRSEDRSKTYIEIDIKRKCENGGIMFYVIKHLIDTLKERYGINIWSILPAEDGFITLNGGFEE